MPRRNYPLVTNEYYHIYNRGINRQPIFLSQPDYRRALFTLKYYQYISQPCRLSHFFTQSKDRQQEILRRMESLPKHVSIIAYCLMPNHFHILLRQESDHGISKFASNFQNSYTKAFNARHKQNSVLLNRQFKSVHVETEEQLLHLSRYIHLNPFSANMISKDEIFTFPWSSAREYIDGKSELLNLEILDLFDSSRYEKFVLEYADDQKELQKVKHLSFDA